MSPDDDKKRSPDDDKKLSLLAESLHQLKNQVVISLVDTELQELVSLEQTHAILDDVFARRSKLLKRLAE